VRTKKEALVRARYIPYVTVVIDHARVARDGAAPAPATFGTTEEAYLAELADPALALELIANNLPITVWCCDKTGVFRVHQGKAAELVGMKPGDLVGLNIFELYTPETVGAIKRAYDGETMHHFSVEYGHHWESWHLPAWGKNGELIGIIGVGLDVSESKRKEQELSTQLELIQQQQQIIRDLGTPIIQVWDDVLTVPMMGVVDSRRAADLMEALLAEVTRTRTRFIILDLTGVELLDTATASHLLRMVAAIRLLMRSSDLAERGGPARPGVSVRSDKPARANQ